MLKDENEPAAPPAGKQVRPPRVTLPEGTVLAGRFEIRREVGRGGGGEVYECRDRQLNETVALKTVRTELAESEEAILRFKREVLLARKVTHPNVCRIFDLFTDRVTLQGVERTVTFLTMELLPGETLGERLRRSGRLAADEALPLVRDITAGLEAAHRAGIIHRDLKSENIRIIPQEDGPGRAVIMDFGLALSSTAQGPSQRLTQQGAVVGTIAYMAPEQLEGRPVSPATDIYALGVVLFEMMTGAQPYEADSLATTLTQKLTQDPPSPRALVPDLPPRYEVVILRCLENDPGDRFASAAEVYDALESDRPVSNPRVARRRRRWIAIAALAAVTLVLLIVAIRNPTRNWRPRKARPSVAVLGFKNLSDSRDAAWLSTAFSELLRSELAAGGSVHALPGDNVARMKAELSLPDSDSISPETLRRIRVNLNADYVVMGSYSLASVASQGQIRLNVRMQDASSGAVVATVDETGTTSALFDLVSRAGAELREELGAAAVQVSQTQEIRAALPATPEAMRYYSEGLNTLRNEDFVRAKDVLEKSVAADPAFPFSRAALAEALAELGYDARAAEAASKSLELATQVSRDERLELEANYYSISGDYNRAVQTYRTLFEFYPDNLDYGLRLSYALYMANQYREAFSVLDALRRFAPPDSQDPRIDVMEAEIALEGSDFPRALQVSERAIEKAGDRGTQILLANAMETKASALYRMGQLQEAAATWTASYEIYRRAGYRVKSIGTIVATGRIYDSVGDLPRAADAYQTGLQTAEELGNTSMMLSSLSNLTLVKSKEGKLDEALQIAGRALDIEQGFPDKSGEAILWRNKGIVLMEQGRLKEARDIFQQWYERTATSSAMKSASLQYYLGQVAALQGDLDVAVKMQQGSMNARLSTGEKGGIAQNKVELAAIAIAQERYEEALRLAGEAAPEFAAEKRKDDEGQCYLVMARAELARGRREGAAEYGAKAASLLGDSHYFRRRMECRILLARLQALSNGRAAVKALSELDREILPAGLPELHLQCRLAAGEAMLQSGDAARAKAALLGLARDAEHAGYGLIAKTAAALGHSRNIQQP